jgi:hypothetical protein
MKKTAKKWKIPIRYLPLKLSKKNKETQIQQLDKSRKLYKKKQYFTRAKIPSFKSRPSQHLARARRQYSVEKIIPSSDLATATGCSINALKQIVRKGEGAYYSSGSRPSQTAHSWGYARLASSLTAGKSAAVDYTILEKGCNHKGPAFKLAQQARKKYGYGHGKTKKVSV